MNNQEVFDKVVTHLLDQGVWSRLTNERSGAAFCAYRGDNGRKCAAGCLIADEHYYLGLEGSVSSDPEVYTALMKSGVPQSAFPLVRMLQRVHDRAEMGFDDPEVHATLRIIAKQFSLNPVPTLGEQA